VVRKIAMANYL